MKELVTKPKDTFNVHGCSRGFVRIFATYPFLLKQDIDPYIYIHASRIGTALLK